MRCVTRSVRVRFFLLAIVLALGVSQNALGVALETGTFGVGPRGDGFGEPSSGILLGSSGDFFRWQNPAPLGTQTISYSFTPAFVAKYGLAAEAKITSDLGQWASWVNKAALPAQSISKAFNAGNPQNDIRLLGFAQTYDFESVALHEIGHVLGLDHSDVASGLNKNTTEINKAVLPTPGTPADPTLANYNVNGAGAFVVGALPGAAHPVMWSVLAANTDRQSLTTDDVYGIQYLYGAGLGGNGTGAALGPAFGGGSALNFNPVANNGNIVFDVGMLGPNTLAETNVNTAAGAGGLLDAPFVASSATVTFAIPEPSTWLLLGLGLALLGARRVAQLRRQ
ncbi:MAG TPA: matrixin family metalloprotease [Pirellulales bacterium]|jgi:hypothetical protein